MAEERKLIDDSVADFPETRIPQRSAFEIEEEEEASDDEILESMPHTVPSGDRNSAKPEITRDQRINNSMFGAKAALDGLKKGVARVSGIGPGPGESFKVDFAKPLTKQALLDMNNGDPSLWNSVMSIEVGQLTMDPVPLESSAAPTITINEPTRENSFSIGPAGSELLKVSGGQGVETQYSSPLGEMVVSDFMKKTDPSAFGTRTKQQLPPAKVSQDQPAVQTQSIQDRMGTMRPGPFGPQIEPVPERVNEVPDPFLEPSGNSPSVTISAMSMLSNAAPSIVENVALGLSSMADLARFGVGAAVGTAMGAASIIQDGIYTVAEHVGMDDADKMRALGTAGMAEMMAEVTDRIAVTGEGAEAVPVTNVDPGEIIGGMFDSLHTSLGGKGYGELALRLNEDPALVVADNSILVAPLLGGGTSVLRGAAGLRGLSAGRFAAATGSVVRQEAKGLLTVNLPQEIRSASSPVGIRRMAGDLETGVLGSEFRAPLSSMERVGNGLRHMGELSFYAAMLPASRRLVDDMTVNVSQGLTEAMADIWGRRALNIDDAAPMRQQAEMMEAIRRPTTVHRTAPTVISEDYITTGALTSVEGSVQLPERLSANLKWIKEKRRVEAISEQGYVLRQKSQKQPNAGEATRRAVQDIADRYNTTAEMIEGMPELVFPQTGVLSPEQLAHKRARIKTIKRSLKDKGRKKPLSDEKKSDLEFESAFLDGEIKTHLRMQRAYVEASGGRVLNDIIDDMASRIDELSPDEASQLQGLERLRSHHVHLSREHTELFNRALAKADIIDAFERRGWQPWPADVDPSRPMDAQFRLAEIEGRPYPLPAAAKEMISKMGERNLKLTKRNRTISEGLRKLTDRESPLRRKDWTPEHADALEAAEMYYTRRSVRDTSTESLRAELANLKKELSKAGRTVKKESKDLLKRLPHEKALLADREIQTLFDLRDVLYGESGAIEWVDSNPLRDSLDSIRENASDGLRISIDDLINDAKSNGAKITEESNSFLQKLKKRADFSNSLTAMEIGDIFSEMSEFSPMQKGRVDAVLPPGAIKTLKSARDIFRKRISSGKDLGFDRAIFDVVDSLLEGKRVTNKTALEKIDGIPGLKTNGTITEEGLLLFIEDAVDPVVAAHREITNRTERAASALEMRKHSIERQIDDVNARIKSNTNTSPSVAAKIRRDIAALIDDSDDFAAKLSENPDNPVGALTSEQAQYYNRYLVNSMASSDNIDTDFAYAIEKSIQKYPELAEDFPSASPHMTHHERGALYQFAADALHSITSPLQAYAPIIRVPFLRSVNVSEHWTRHFFSRLRNSMGDLGPDRILPWYQLDEANADEVAEAALRRAQDPDNADKRVYRGGRTVEEVLDDMESRHGHSRDVIDFRSVNLRRLIETDPSDPSFNEIWQRAPDSERSRFISIRGMMNEAHQMVNDVRRRNGLEPIGWHGGYLPRVMADVIRRDSDIAELLGNKNIGTRADVHPALEAGLEDLLNGSRISDRPSTPGKSVNPSFTKERGLTDGNLRGKINTREILEQYFRSVSRVLAWTDTLPHLSKHVRNLKKQGRLSGKVLEAQILDQLGYSGPITRLTTQAFDTIANAFHSAAHFAVPKGQLSPGWETRLDFALQPEVTGSAFRVASKINKWVVRRYLSTSIRTATRNLTDQLRVAALGGVSNWAQAISGSPENQRVSGVRLGLDTHVTEIFHPDAMTALTESGVTDGWLPQYYAMQSEMPHWVDSVLMSPFQAGDYINRGVAYQTGYILGLKRGLTPRQAVAAAAEFTNRTAFKYNSPYTSPFFRNPLTSAAAPFMKYNFKFAEFAAEMAARGIRGTEDYFAAKLTPETRDYLGLKRDMSPSKLKDIYESWRFFALSGFMIGAGDPEILWNKFLGFGSQSNINPILFGLANVMAGRVGGSSRSATLRRLTGRASTGTARNVADLAQAAVRGGVGAGAGYVTSNLIPRFGELPSPSLGGISFGVESGEEQRSLVMSYESDRTVSDESMRHIETGQLVPKTKISESEMGEYEEVELNGEWNDLAWGGLPEEMKIRFGISGLQVDAHSLFFGGLIPPEADRALERGNFLDLMGSIVSSPTIESAGAFGTGMLALSSNLTEVDARLAADVSRNLRTNSLPGSVGNVVKNFTSAPRNMTAGGGAIGMDSLVDPFLGGLDPASPDVFERSTAIIMSAIPSWLGGLPIGGVDHLSRSFVNLYDSSLQPHNQETGIPTFNKPLSKGELFMSDFFGVNPSKARKVVESKLLRQKSADLESSLSSYYSKALSRAMSRGDMDKMNTIIKSVNTHIANGRLSSSVWAGKIKAMTDAAGGLSGEMLEVLGGGRGSKLLKLQMHMNDMYPQIDGDTGITPGDAIELLDMFDEALDEEGQDNQGAPNQLKLPSLR